MENKLNIVLIDKDETSKNIIKSYLSEIEDFQQENISLIEFFDINLGQEFVSKASNSIILIETSQEPEKALEIIKEIKDSKKNNIVVALSNRTSTETIIKVMRAGAKEFITKPIIKTEFINLLTQLKKELQEPEQKESCKVISTFSNKGGIGKTSIAVNLATELAQMTKEKVALLDLNLQLGDVATFLDLNPTFAMDYIANNVQNLDETELLKTMTKYKNTSLYVIADPLNIDKSQEITAEQIKTIITILKKTFAYIVIDIGTNIDSKTITALDLSDLILLIAIVNLPAIRSTQRCMELFNKLNYKKDKIKLVLNRYMENEDIKTSDIEDVVQQKVYWKIPNNYLTMVSAINKGVSISEINNESNLAKNYKEFASNISDYLITQKFNKNTDN